MGKQKKKEIPLAVLEEINNRVVPLFLEGTKYSKRIKDDDTLFDYIDNDSDSDFYFKIITFEIRSGGTIYYKLIRKPASKTNLLEEDTWRHFEGLKQYFNQWIDIIKAYENNINPIGDDAILESYRVEFEKMFDILDEDADISPFNLDQQIYLDNYLEHVKKQMKLLSEGKSKEEKQELSEIENDAIHLQRDLTKETKRIIIRRLSKILAKARRIGLEVFKQVAIDILAEAGKKILLGGS